MTKEQTLTLLHGHLQAKLPAMRAELEANNFVFVLVVPCPASASVDQE
jgi:hypothetical protein